MRRVLDFRFKKNPVAPNKQDNRNVFLFTETEFLDEGAVLVNVFFRVVRKQALALADHGKQGAAGGVVFRVGAKVIGEAFDAVGQQSHLCFCVAGVFLVATVLLDDGGDFFFGIVNCH